MVTFNRHALKITAPVLFFLILLPVNHIYGMSKFMNQPNKVILQEDMKTYRIGRFAIDLPVKFNREQQGSTIQRREIEEIIWEKGTNPKDRRDALWNARLEKIKLLTLPPENNKVLIEEQEFTINNHLVKAVYYYEDSDSESTKSAYWELFLGLETMGIWFTTKGKTSTKDLILSRLIKVVKAYKPLNFVQSSEGKNNNWHYLKYGAIGLSYLWGESTYARFKDYASGINQFEFETKSVYKVEKAGLLDKLTAVIMTNFAPGVNIKKLRTGKRIVAGIQGEEMLLRVKQDGETELSFTWSYPGKENSGESPYILIDLEADDDKVDEKIAMWDAILDSMRSLGR